MTLNKHLLKKISIGKKIFFVFIVFVLSFNIAKADNTVVSGISDVFNFINKNIVSQIRNDFCKQYILSISTGEWKSDEFRTKIGKKVCTSYKISDNSTEKISQKTIQQLDLNSITTQAESTNTPSVNVPTPNVYIPDTVTSGTGLSISQIINLTNTERKNNNSSLVNLKENNTLKKIAMIRVRDMFNNQYFEHNSPTGDNVSKEAVSNNYSYVTIGENIALGNFAGSSGLVTAWMNSTGHRANILNTKYTEIGVYFEQGTYKGQSVWIAAQVFGKPASSCKSPDTSLKSKINSYKASAESIMTSITKIDEELKTISATDTTSYNAKVAERNTLATLYNNLAKEIKTKVAEYNEGVTEYNACVKL